MNSLAVFNTLAMSEIQSMITINAFFSNSARKSIVIDVRKDDDHNFLLQIYILAFHLSDLKSLE